MHPFLTTLMAQGLLGGVGVAWAVDVDGDGYQPPLDCADTIREINPDSQEVIGNGIDEDCDRSDALFRRFLVTSFSLSVWTDTGAVSRSVDDITVGDGTSAGSASATMAAPLPKGKVHLIVDVNAITGSCSATATVGAKSATVTLSATGTTASGALAVDAVPTSPSPMRTLSGLSISCPAGSSVTVDWMSVQNTSDIFPPSRDLTIAWDDVDLPAGGLNTTVVRRDDSTAPILYAASDLGGVAWSDPSTMTWTTINGIQGSDLVTQAGLGVWDILPVNGKLWALTGRTIAASGAGTWHGMALAGGLFESDDNGMTWTEVINTHTPTLDVGVGGYGRYGECTSGGSVLKTYGGGKLLEDEPTVTSDLFYIANGDEDSLGVWIHDDTGDVCALPNSGTALPTSITTTGGAGYVRALARVESATSGFPVLLVGYLARAGSDAQLYACTLPTDAYNDVDLTCGATNKADCVVVTDADGLDIRDIEVDPLDPSTAYLASGGDDPDTSCGVDVGGVFELQVDDDGADTTVSVVEIPNAFSEATGLHVTGVSVEPNGQYLYAFVPASPDLAYRYDRIYRIDLDGGTLEATDWLPVNGDDTDADADGRADDEEARAATISDNAWLTSDHVVRPESVPGRFAGGEAIDAIWAPTTDTSGLDYAIVSTTFNLWVATGLDDTDAAWDPDTDTSWVFAPDADAGNHRTFQNVVVNDIAMDANGNIWMPSADLGLAMLPDDNHVSERDCLWNAVNGGGAEVSVGEDDSVWVSIYSQDSASYPHDIGVFRTLDHGGSWEFQGAGVHYSDYRDDADDVTWYCTDKDSSHEATPLGSSSGTVFNGTVDGTLPSADTWGNPMLLTALNQDAAAVVFQTWSVLGDSMTGRLAFTLDGGASWKSVTFDGAYDGSGTTSPCDAASFFTNPVAMSAVTMGNRTYAADTDADGTIESGEYQLDLMLASHPATAGTTRQADMCSLARVVVNGDPASPTVAWTWYKLDDPGTSGWTCTVDDSNIRGVATSPWSTEAWVYGSFTHTNVTVADVYTGGACALDIAQPNSAQLFIDPSTHWYDLVDIVPNSQVTDTLLVIPQLSASAWFECTEKLHDGTSMSCSDMPAPTLMERAGTTWDEWRVPAAPPSLVGTAAAWKPLSDPGILYATEGAGAWEGSLSW